MIQTYELTLVTPVMPEAKQKAFADKIEKLLGEAGGKVERTDEWGKRELAYPLRKNKEGYYYNLLLSLGADRVNAFTRYLDNDDEVLRHLIIKSTISAHAFSRAKGKRGTESKEKVSQVSQVSEVSKVKEEKKAKKEVKTKSAVKKSSKKVV